MSRGQVPRGDFELVQEEQDIGQADIGAPTRRNMNFPTGLLRFLLEQDIVHLRDTGDDDGPYLYVYVSIVSQIVSVPKCDLVRNLHELAKTYGYYPLDEKRPNARWHRFSLPGNLIQPTKPLWFLSTLVRRLIERAHPNEEVRKCKLVPDETLSEYGRGREEGLKDMNAVRLGKIIEECLEVRAAEGVLAAVNRAAVAILEDAGAYREVVRAIAWTQRACFKAL